jgi:carboxypeptidase Taq
MPRPLEELRARLREIDDLNMSAALLRWDQATYMPPGGAPARGRQLATLGAIAHARLTDPALGALIAKLEPWAAGLPYDSDDAALVRVARRDVDMAVQVPSSLVAELNEHASASYQAWAEARPANDFARVRAILEKTVELSRRLADCFPGYASPADPLIAYSDYGLKASQIRTLFAELRARLVPLVQAITARPLADDTCIRQAAPETDQLAFGLDVIRRYGYDFTRGRQDKTHHPFMIKFSLGDVRITTRLREDDLTDALFSTLHEAGHGMYEQGIRRDLESTPLGTGASSGVHESQSRLWENLVGRSLPFWTFFYPRLQQAFPTQLGRFPLDTFYRAINRVERSLIRTDADEVTYNLHVMLRFDLECDLLEGRLAVKDLPEAWRERFQRDIGIPVPDDRDGCLQDVHWYSGLVGGQFQGYTLGNILSAQFMETAVRARPEIPARIAEGEFATLHDWLGENIYQHGAKFTADELVKRVTGGPMTIEPYIAYLWRKYAPLYGLEIPEPAPALR